MASNKAPIIYVGDTFGRLTVLHPPESHRTANGHTYRVCECRCECGNTVTVPTSRLRSSETRSCGCLTSESAKDRFFKHGASRDGGAKLYNMFRTMISRCENPKTLSYPNYGGRGISVSDAWRHDFEAFQRWSLNNGYAEGLQLDRINGDGNYCPDNCRWVTRIVNARNTRRNVWLTAWGETKCLTEWANDQRCVVPLTTVARRIKRGWLPLDALTKPPYPNGNGQDCASLSQLNNQHKQ